MNNVKLPSFGNHADAVRRQLPRLILFLLLSFRSIGRNGWIIKSDNIFVRIEIASGSNWPGLFKQIAEGRLFYN